MYAEVMKWVVFQPKIKQVNKASHLDKEEMYDEIQRLKEMVAAYQKEKALRQTKIQKLEKELTKKVDNLTKPALCVICSSKWSITMQ